MGIDIGVWRQRIGLYRHRGGFKQISLTKTQGGDTDTGDMNSAYRAFICTLVFTPMLLLSAVCINVGPNAFGVVSEFSSQAWSTHYPKNNIYTLGSQHIFSSENMSTMCTSWYCSVQYGGVDCQPYPSHTNPFIAYLLTIGNVELNPGPIEGLEEVKNAILKEIEGFRNEVRTGMQSVKNEITEVRNDIITLDSKCEKMHCEVQGIKASVLVLQDDMKACEQNEDILRLDIEALDVKCHKLDVKCYTLENELEMGTKTVDNSKVEKLEAELDKLEAYSRRENVIIYGIDEEKPNESYTDCKKSVLNLLQVHVDIGERIWSERDLVRSHRLRKAENRPPEEPRPMIVRFLHWQDKLSVTAARDTLLQAGYKVANDLTVRQRELVRQAYAQGKTGFFQQGKFVMRDRDDIATESDMETGHSHNDFTNSASQHRRRIFSRSPDLREATPTSR